MSARVAIKIGLVLMLIIAPIASPLPADWFTIVLVSLGIANAVLEAHGTLVVRALAVAGVLTGLLSSQLRPVILMLAWLVWPVAFLTTWAVAREKFEESSVQTPEAETAARRARVRLAAVIAAVAVASIAYRLIVGRGLQQTAALFIGVPALLAIVVVFLASPRTAPGVACKAVTVGLLVSLLFLWEGMLCVVMAAPLFYAVAIGIAAAVETARRRRYHSPTITGLILLVSVPMSLEGVTPFTTLNRNELVSVTKAVDASPEQIERALFEQPRFDRALPPYLRAGFPMAIATRVDQNEDGMRWIIQVRGGEMRINGMEPRTGELILALEESRPGFVRWRAISDTSHMTHFLRWRDIVVQWNRVEGDRTNVTWTLGYERGLDPAWYFGPWERYAVRLAAGYLIDSVATP